MAARGMQMSEPDSDQARRLKLIADSMADIEEFERGRADEDSN